MFPSKYEHGQSSAVRHSKIEGKRSLLPKPRQFGSIDPSEGRRPSTASYRSSSAEPPRATFGGGRLSREASATNIKNSRSRSQQPESRYGQPATTPLCSNHYSRCSTTTPQRTPSQDRSNRSWETSLNRALACVTVKDQRPITSAAWQRSECQRVGEALAARAEYSGGGNSGMVLIRPLTIARFVEITGALLQSISNNDDKLTTYNYLAKLPHQSKRLLYPGTVSKSWLKTVNTLHAFPHALALIAYLLDLVNHIEAPIIDDWLYLHKDDFSCLRRNYLLKRWVRFQLPGQQFEDLKKEYLQNLKIMLGINDEKTAELRQVVKRYEACLADEAEIAAKAEVERRRERREALAAELRQERASRLALRSQYDTETACTKDLAQALRQVDQDIERANAEKQRLCEEIAQQPLSVSERTRLLDEVDYAVRVLDSKRTLADQIAKTILSRETEVALWQKKTLNSCVEYKQGLIHLSAKCQDVSAYAIDEKDLMTTACAEKVSGCVAALRERAAIMARQKAQRTTERSARRRQNARLVEEGRAKIAELRSLVELEKQTLEGEVTKENAEAAEWRAEKLEMEKRMDSLRTTHEHHAELEAELDFWEQQNITWQEKLATFNDNINRKKEEGEQLLEAAKEKRYKIVMNKIRLWNEKLAQ